MFWHEHRGLVDAPHVGHVLASNLPPGAGVLLGARPLLSRHGYVDRGVVGIVHGGLPEHSLVCSSSTASASSRSLESWAVARSLAWARCRTDMR